MRFLNKIVMAAVLVSMVSAASMAFPPPELEIQSGGLVGLDRALYIHGVDQEYVRYLKELCEPFASGRHWDCR